MFRFVGLAGVVVVVVVRAIRRGLGVVRRWNSYLRRRPRLRTGTICCTCSGGQRRRSRGSGIVKVVSHVWGFVLEFVGFRSLVWGDLIPRT